MVETAIYILLGALSSALLALLALPAVSRRAFRLAQRRAALTAPLSAAQASAERDALRARHAVELVQVERRAERAGQEWAAAQIEIGRQSRQILARDEALEAQAQEIARQREELAGLAAELRARDAEIGARETALRDAFAQRDAAQRRLGENVARLADAQALAEEEHGYRARQEKQIAALTRELDAGEFVAGRNRGEEQDGPALPKARALDLLASAGFDQVDDPHRDRRVEAAMRESDPNQRLSALSAARLEAEAALRGARNERDAAQRELDRLREADAELRAAIARLGRDIVAHNSRIAAGENLFSQP